MNNETAKITVADTLCSHCTRTCCAGCDVEGLQDSSYEEIVNALLLGFSMAAIRQSYVGAAV